MLNNAEQMEKDGFNGATITQLLMIILPKTSTLLYPSKVIQDFTDFLKDFKHSGLLKISDLILAFSIYLAHTLEYRINVQQILFRF